MRKLALSLALATSLILAACQNQETQVVETPPIDQNQSIDQEQNLVQEEGRSFPEFATQDLDGNPVDSSIFGENDLTMVNFWFTGCSACVSEMPLLAAMEEDLAQKSVGLIGICADASFSPELLEDAINIVKSNNVAYPNLIVSQDQDFRTYIDSIMAYPTTIFVNSDGKLVGRPIVGALQSQDDVEAMQGMIDALLEQNI